MLGRRREPDNRNCHGSGYPRKNTSWLRFTLSAEGTNVGLSRTDLLIPQREHRDIRSGL